MSLRSETTTRSRFLTLFHSSLVSVCSMSVAIRSLHECEELCPDFRLLEEDSTEGARGHHPVSLDPAHRHAQVPPAYEAPCSQQLTLLHELVHNVHRDALLQDEAPSLGLYDARHLTEAWHIAIALGEVPYCHVHLNWKQVVRAEAPDMVGIADDHLIVAVVRKLSPLHSRRRQHFPIHVCDAPRGLSEVRVLDVCTQAFQNVQHTDGNELLVHTLPFLRVLFLVGLGLVAALHAQESLP